MPVQIERESRESQQRSDSPLIVSCGSAEWPVSLLSESLFLVGSTLLDIFPFGATDSDQADPSLLPSSSW